MKWKSSKKFIYAMALIVFVGAPLAINHFSEWDSEKITSTCKLDQEATSVAINRDIVERRVIPQSDSRADFAVWNCPDGKVRATRKSPMADAQGQLMKASTSP